MANTSLSKRYDEFPPKCLGLLLLTGRLSRGAGLGRPARCEFTRAPWTLNTHDVPVAYHGSSLALSVHAKRVYTQLVQSS